MEVVVKDVEEFVEEDIVEVVCVAVDVLPWEVEVKVV